MLIFSIESDILNRNVIWSEERHHPLLEPNCGVIKSLFSKPCPFCTPQTSGESREVLERCHVCEYPHLKVM